MRRQQIRIETADGVAPAALFSPDSNPAGTGVILYMDAFGPRLALDRMAERLVGEGYAVLVPDLFYRFGEYGPFDAKTAFADEKTGAQIRHMLGATTQAMTIADSGAFLDTLAAHGVTGKVGAVGYCMGGARALNAVAAYPDRIVSAASFHGGNLAGEADDSPHRQVAKIKGRVYVGAAGVDRSFPPEQSARLALALAEAEVDYVLENYFGMEHGWAVPDHRVFNEAGAERHWRRLATFFGETLGG